MTNQDYWQTIVGPVTPEEFLRAYGTADPELGLERFLEERGQFCGVVNQSTWVSTFEATEQYHVLTVRVYLESYLDETREEWQPALEAQPPKVVRRYRPVYDFPVPAAAPADSDGESGESDVVVSEYSDDSESEDAHDHHPSESVQFDDSHDVAVEAPLDGADSLSDTSQTAEVDVTFSSEPSEEVAEEESAATDESATTAHAGD